MARGLAGVHQQAAAAILPVAVADADADAASEAVSRLHYAHGWLGRRAGFSGKPQRRVQRGRDGGGARSIPCSDCSELGQPSVPARRRSA